MRAGTKYRAPTTAKADLLGRQVAGRYIQERFLAACPGASRKGKCAGHFARNDGARDARKMRSAVPLWNLCTSDTNDGSYEHVRYRPSLRSLSEGF